MTRADAWWFAAWGATMLTCTILVWGYTDALSENTDALVRLLAGVGR